MRKQSRHGSRPTPRGRPQPSRRPSAPAFEAGYFGPDGQVEAFTSTWLTEGAPDVAAREPTPLEEWGSFLTIITLREWLDSMDASQAPMMHAVVMSNEIGLPLADAIIQTIGEAYALGKHHGETGTEDFPDLEADLEQGSDGDGE